jgi:hypothetical protein
MFSGCFHLNVLHRRRNVVSDQPFVLCFTVCSSGHFCQKVETEKNSKSKISKRDIDLSELSGIANVMKRMKVGEGAAARSCK